MTIRALLKEEIDNLDEEYLPLVLKVIRQFPNSQRKPQDASRAVQILQEIADSGGLRIDDPVAWQREIRIDRKLPF
jgi:hypothetical protein